MPRIGNDGRMWLVLWVAQAPVALGERDLTLRNAGSGRKKSEIQRLHRLIEVIP